MSEFGRVWKFQCEAAGRSFGRIVVTSPVGSGKTTWAARLGEQVGSPVRPLDDIHRVRHPSGDRRREPHERLQLLARLVRTEAWIVEGVPFKGADAAMRQADLIVVRDVPRRCNIIRILRRSTARRRSAAPNPRGTPAALRGEIGRSADDRNHERAMPVGSVARWVEEVRVVRSRHDMDAVGMMVPLGGAR